MLCALLRLRIAVAGVWSVGSSAAGPCLDVRSSRRGMDLHWGFHQESHRNPGSSAAAAAAAAAAAVAVAALVLGLGVGSAVARVAAHTAVSQAEARNVVVGWYCRQEEAGSVVVGVREEM